MSLPLVFKTTFKGAIITVHGENHSDIDNDYYLSLNLSGILLVEHSRSHRYINPSEEHLFQKHARGSEWVYYHEQKNPNLICFDTRTEQGFLNAFEEKDMIARADKLPENPSLFMELALREMTALSENRDIFKEEYFKRSYDMLEGQMRAIMKMIRLTKAGESQVIGLPLKELLPGLAYTFALNLRKMASISVDIHLLKILKELAPKEKEIQVFCGKNHLMRLSKALRGEVEDGEIEMSGDAYTDKRICEA